MADEIYLKLRKFLDQLPGGYPSTESGVEMRILKKLFTPEQAKMAVHLHQIPEPVEIIAKRMGMGESQAAEMLESMAKEGLIFRVRDEVQPFYSAAQFVIGIYEFHLNTIDRELSDLVEEYFPYLAEVWESTKTKQLRVVPINSSVNTAPAVSSYDHIRELVKDVGVIAVAPCICQKEQRLRGTMCDRPPERCLVFNEAAQYYIENELGRQVSRNELLEILRRGEEAALVLCPTNSQRILNICMCCGCCCGVLRLLRTFPRPAEQVNSPFQAEVDPDRCTACGTCEARCQMEAIKAGAEYYQIDKERCIGCGLCIPPCPEQAIALQGKGETVPVPDNIFEMQMRIAKERGVI